LLVEIDEQRVGVGRRKSVTFNEWADRYLDEILPLRGVKGSTLRAYSATLDAYARPLFGTLEIDRVGSGELRRFVQKIKETGASDATVYKHVKALGSVLRAAEAEEPPLIDKSPLTRKFVRDLRLRVGSGDEAYTDEELAKLWAAMSTLRYKDVYVTVCKLAVATGARQGELVALDWDDLNLTNRTLRIRRHFDPIDGLVAPKDRDERTVNLTPAAVALLEAWTASEGVRPGDSPIFRAPRSDGRLNGRYLRKLVDKAIEKAGLSDVGEGGRHRRPFHAFRATYTRLCRERGLDPQWVAAQLGHADIALTVGVYGRWADSAMRAEAERLEDALPFPV
jgi:integrase